jgi:hypothetical protein
MSNFFHFLAFFNPPLPHLKNPRLSLAARITGLDVSSL